VGCQFCCGSQVAKDRAYLPVSDRRKASATFKLPAQHSCTRTITLGHSSVWLAVETIQSIHGGPAEEIACSLRSISCTVFVLGSECFQTVDSGSHKRYKVSCSHGDKPEDRVDFEIRALLNQYHPQNNMTGPVLGAASGPGTDIVLYPVNRDGKPMPS
jgi:hypothetical protein